MKPMNEYLTELERCCRENDIIDRRLYEEYDINQGLRDEKGNGVLTGLTNISLIKSYEVKNGAKEPLFRDRAAGAAGRNRKAAYSTDSILSHPRRSGEAGEQKMPCKIRRNFFALFRQSAVDGGGRRW